MFKHLKYADENSDKFWQIEVSGNSHTVTFGKTGTSGQAKTKTFDSEEACLKDANKLIAEKIKKGYVEDGTVPTISAESKVTSSPKTAPGKSKYDKDSIARELKELILETNFAGVLPFLEKYVPGNTEFLRKTIKGMKNHWNTSDKRDLISAVAMAVFNLSDTRDWRDQLAEAMRSKIPEVYQVLDWAKPTWLGEYLLQQQRRDSLYFSYEDLRKMEAMGYVPFDPELFALFISVAHKGMDYICTDELAYTRDVPLLFEYETTLHTTRNYASQEYSLLWDATFERLIAEGKMEKEFLLIHVLEMQTKSWQIHIKAFFRKLILQIGLEKELVIRNQARFFPLLHSEQSAVVNFAIDALKPYLDEKDFDLAEFLQWTEPVFMRNDMKGGVKSLLIQLDKTVVQKSGFKNQVSALVADVFMIPDLPLQERAANFLLKHGKEAEIGEKLAMYASQMLGKVANELKPLMNSDEAGDEPNEVAQTNEEYKFDPAPVQKLMEKIVYPETWNDILFHVGKVVKTDNTVDIEILLHSWLCKRELFPADFKKQIAPFLSQLNKYRSESWYYYFNREFLLFLHGGERVHDYEKHYHGFTYTILTLSELSVLVQQRILDKVFLPLLSTPTHEPFWVDPAILVERIIGYENAGKSIDLTDFAVSLSRMPRENVAEATQKLAEVKDENVKKLLDFALGNTTSIQKGKSLEWSGLWALVARTHSPDAVFNEFSDFKKIPFMSEPFRPGLQTKADYWGQYNVKLGAYEQTEYLGDILDINFPIRLNIPSTFVYGKDLFLRDGGRAWYIHNSDVTLMYSLMPQNTEALALFLVTIFNAKGENDYKQTPILLRHMLNSFYVFDPASIIYLATSIFNKGKDARSFASEILIKSIDENRLPLEELGSNLGVLIDRHYAPVNRMLGVFESVKDVSFKHNYALFKLLELLINEIKPSEKMPANVKKVLEFYYDLKHKLNRLVSPAVEKSLIALADLKPLQPMISKIRK